MLLLIVLLVLLLGGGGGYYGYSRWGQAGTRDRRDGPGYCVGRLPGRAGCIEFVRIDLTRT
jgi:hypothetical protein